MPDKYSLAKCEQYGRRLAARLCQQHFGPQPDATLAGPALRTFTPLRQVNLLLLQQLLGRWQHEAEQLRSPYFDFAAEPVQAALAQFMNVLSRHIAVGRAALEPLLAQAVAYTLLLRTDPGQAFERLLLPPAESADDAVPPAYLRERLRYLDQSKAFFEGFVASLPGGNAPLSHEFLVQRLELYRASHYKELPPLAALVAELSALLPLTEADLWDDGPSAPAPVRPPAAASPGAPPAAAAEAPKAAAPAAPLAPTEPAPTAQPAAARAPAVPAEPTAAAAAAPPLPAVAAVPEPPLPVAAPPAPVPPAPKEAPQPAAPDAPASVPLYEKLKATQPSAAPLAATLREATHSAPTLAERGAPKVGSLREAISINQRYSFINELFNGENDDYQATIAHLDALPTAEAATAYVQHELAPHHDWSRKEEHVGRLLKLIERKFGQHA